MCSFAVSLTCFPVEFLVPKRKPPAPAPVPAVRLVPLNTHVMAVLPDGIALRCVNHRMSTIDELATTTDDDLRDRYQFPKQEIDQIRALLAEYGMVRGPRSPELSPPYRR